MIDDTLNLNADGEEYDARPAKYDERYRDIRAERIVTVDGDGGMEIYGTDLDGRRVWLWVHDVNTAERIHRDPEGSEDRYPARGGITRGIA